MDDKEKLKETEAQIIENTLRWITWTIESTRTYILSYHFNTGQLQMGIIAMAKAIESHLEIKDDPNDDGDTINKIYRGLWKDVMIPEVKTPLASMFYLLELHKTYIALADENIKELKEVQKILFSTRNKRLEEAVKYIDQMYDENDDIFEKRLATAKIEAKKTDHAIEISHKNAIDTAFRILSLKLHPDKGGDTERFKILQEMHDYLLRVDLEHEHTVKISTMNEDISEFQVSVEEDFQVVRKLLQGKSIPKNWGWDEKSIKKMADDGVDTSPFL